MKRCLADLPDSQGSIIRDLFKLIKDPATISMGGGNPSLDAFPSRDLAVISSDLLNSKGGELLQYGLTDGYEPFLQACLKHTIGPKGIRAGLENIITLTGSSQGLFILGKICLRPGDYVLAEDPTFLGALASFKMFGGQVIPVKTDHQGMDMEDLEAKIIKYQPKMIYAIPTFQNPTGHTMPVENRRRLAELGSRYDVIILEDDPYCDVRFAGQELPPIKSFDQTGHTVYLNSYSKTIAPGLRVGVAVADAELIHHINLVKQEADTHTPTLNQAICAEYLERGLMPAHMEQVRAMYRERLAAMIEGIQRWFPEGCEYLQPEGGLFLWLKLQGEQDSAGLLQKAIESCHITFVPGSVFYSTPGLGFDCIRLNYSFETAEKLYIAMERLGGLLHQRARR